MSERKAGVSTATPNDFLRGDSVSFIWLKVFWWSRTARARLPSGHLDSPAPSASAGGAGGAVRGRRARRRRRRLRRQAAAAARAARVRARAARGRSQPRRAPSPRRRRRARRPPRRTPRPSPPSSRAPLDLRASTPRAARALRVLLDARVRGGRGAQRGGRVSIAVARRERLPRCTVPAPGWPPALSGRARARAEAHLGGREVARACAAQLFPRRVGRDALGARSRRRQTRACPARRPLPYHARASRGARRRPCRRARCSGHAGASLRPRPSAACPRACASGRQSTRYCAPGRVGTAAPRPARELLHDARSRCVVGAGRRFGPRARGSLNASPATAAPHSTRARRPRARRRPSSRASGP